MNPEPFYDIHINDTLAVTPQESITFPINSVFDVPVDFILKGEAPIDRTISVPIKDKFNAEVMLKDKIP
jgi:hypothetical protein